MSSLQIIVGLWTLLLLLLLTKTKGECVNGRASGTVCSNWSNGTATCLQPVGNNQCPAGYTSFLEGFSFWACEGICSGSICCTSYVTQSPATATPTMAPTTMAPTTATPTMAPTTATPTMAPTSATPTIAPTTTTPTSTSTMTSSTTPKRPRDLTNSIRTPLSTSVARNSPSSDYSNYVVVVGEHNTSKIEYDTNFNPPRQREQFVRVRDCVTHPNFVDATTAAGLPLSDTYTINAYGLALVHLAEPIRNPCASTACLPSAAPWKLQDCGTYNDCIMLGWGFVNKEYTNWDYSLKKGFVTVYRGDVCQFMQNSANETCPPMSACQASSYGQEGCLTDEGGPILCYDGYRWAVQAIIPWGLCFNNKPNLCVIDVEQAEPWILDYIRANP